MAVITGTTAVKSLRHNRDATMRTKRPMMVAVLSPTGKMSAGLVVSNAGPSIARDVKVSFDPPLPTHDTTDDGQQSIIPFVRNRYSKSIAAWAPGYVARNAFLILGDEKDEQGRPTNVDGIPRETDIVFEYQDDDGNLYADRMSLDPTLIEGETWSVNKRNRGGEETILHDGSPWLNE
ncbi:hypothetical protein [Gordonia sp. NPDC003376]